MQETTPRLGCAYNLMKAIMEGRMFLLKRALIVGCLVVAPCAFAQKAGGGGGGSKGGGGAAAPPPSTPNRGGGGNVGSRPTMGPVYGPNGGGIYGNDPYGPYSNYPGRV